MSRLGIDLGTANSAAALFFEGQAIDDHNPRMIEPLEGSYHGASIIPSYVAFNADGSLSAVGKGARERFEHGETGNVVRHLKRLIGRPYRDVRDRAERGERTFAEFKDRLREAGAGKLALEIGGRTMTLEDIVAFLLQKIFSEARRVADAAGDPVSAVTIGLPAGFDDMQREATFEAATKAGLQAVRVIEEPTAAALARSLEGCTGTILVIDIGAGTTDIVAGSMTQDVHGHPSFSCSARTCDDELGGIDMDYLIFEHLLEQDRLAPRLSDVYMELDPAAKGQLMGAIENAKVQAVLSASMGVPGLIATVLRVGTKAKPLNMQLSEAQLDQLVAPLLLGRREGETIKGVKPLLERTLLEIAMVNPDKLARALRDPSLGAVVSYFDPRLLRKAGYDADQVTARVGEAIREVEHLVLVGGPCRMRSVRRMLAEMFASNPAVRRQLGQEDPEDAFCMEAVACGATMSRGTQGARVPYNISLFTWRHGRRVVVIPKGAPYLRSEDLTLTGAFVAEEGGDALHVLSEKDCPRRHWPYREYVLQVPKKGSVRVSLTWREEGLEPSRALLDARGAGLPGSIQFPPLKETATLGDKVLASLREFAEAAACLRQLLPGARERAARELTKAIMEAYPFLSAADPAVKQATAQFLAENLDVPEGDLAHCDQLDLNSLYQPGEEELERVLQDGYFAVRDDLAVRKWGLSPKALSALKYAGFKMPDISFQELMGVAECVVQHAGGHLGGDNDYLRQASEAFSAVQSAPGDRERQSALATTCWALAQHLMGEGIGEPIPHLYDMARSIAHFYHPDASAGRKQAAGLKWAQ
jgi:molecular chaperone DnaK (HSP70)